MFCHNIVESALRDVHPDHEDTECDKQDDLTGEMLLHGE